MVREEERKKGREVGGMGRREGRRKRRKEGKLFIENIIIKRNIFIGKFKF